MSSRMIFLKTDTKEEVAVNAKNVLYIQPGPQGHSNVFFANQIMLTVEGTVREVSGRLIDGL